AGLVHRDEFTAVRPLTLVAMGLLLFLIGRRLGLGALRGARRLVLVAGLSYSVTGVAVFVATRAVGAPLTLALVLSALAGGGAPMTVTSIVRRMRARDAYAQSLVGVHAAVDWLAAVAFVVVLPLAMASDGAAGSFGLGAALGVSLPLTALALGAAAARA